MSTSTVAKRDSEGEKAVDASKTADYSKYYNSPVMSDIIIHYSGRVFHGHKVILSHSAVWFEIAFGHDGWVEFDAKEVTLKGDNPDALEGMFKFLYNIDPQPFEKYVHNLDIPPMPTADRVLYSMELYRVADKYNCDSLMEAAFDMFHRELRNTTRVMADYVFSYGHHIGRVSSTNERGGINWKLRCAVPAETLREIAEAVYELQDLWIGDGRSPITSDFVAHFFDYHEISPIKQGVCIDAVFKVAQEVPELGSDLFKEIMDRKGHGSSGILKSGWIMCSLFQCPACNEQFPSPTLANPTLVGPNYCGCCGHKLR